MLTHISHMTEKLRKIYSSVQAGQGGKQEAQGSPLLQQANKTLKCLWSTRLFFDFKTSLLAFVLGNTVMNVVV